MRIWAAHFEAGSRVWSLISTRSEPVLPAAQGDRLPAVRASASKFSADAPVLSAGSSAAAGLWPGAIGDQELAACDAGVLV